MSINVSVITTANTTRHFVLNSVGSISHLLLNLKRSSRIFTGNLLVIGSGAQTEIFSTASIASVEMESANDLEIYLPRGQSLTLTALTTVEAIEPFEGGLESEFSRCRSTSSFVAVTSSTPALRANPRPRWPNVLRILPASLNTLPGLPAAARRYRVDEPAGHDPSGDHSGHPRSAERSVDCRRPLTWPVNPRPVVPRW